MELAEIAEFLKHAGGANVGQEKLKIVSHEELENRAANDRYSAAVKKALEVNSDEIPLYEHQYEALYALAEGKDVLMITPCGSGKTRVLENGPEVARLGFELRNNDLPFPINPLGIVCCPLSSIMEEKLSVQENSGIVSMYGACTISSEERMKQSLSKSEAEDVLMSDRLNLIYGHPESFTTEMGKNILESNESRICLFATDEVGFNIWGPDFRIFMSTVPGSIRAFAPSAPMLCMSATVGKSEQAKILGELGMLNREHRVIASNPIKGHHLVTKLKRPSNQTGFNEEGGLGEMLVKLCLGEFVSDPVNCRKTVIFCKNEEDLVQIYEFIEGKIGSVFQNMKSRPWVQYHSSLGERTLKWIHKRLEKSEGEEIRLILSTYKLVMGVDLQDVDLAIFVRLVFVLSLQPLIGNIFQASQHHTLSGARNG